MEFLKDKNISKLALGTVQWGQAYGISNTKGKTPQDEVKRILSIAKLNNINLLDTAHHYGDSEVIIGKSNFKDFKIITKTGFFKNNYISALDKENLISTFKESLTKLSLRIIFLKKPACLLLKTLRNLLSLNFLFPTKFIFSISTILPS